MYSNNGIQLQKCPAIRCKIVNDERGANLKSTISCNHSMGFLWEIPFPWTCLAINISV